ncbi:PP2C family protein-serine/threonine phosphatase [Paraburkholderia caribensis]|uniref:PP2C family protein-serine/threonine phosphatase n=1 Tax=Paraburkholderia caribensis TaxID=75105 RepID=UPI0011E03114|nr:protein phosphatase 2C domain-containing protein [Paraburkholderia caribensis]
MHETSGIHGANAGANAGADGGGDARTRARPRAAGSHARRWSVGQRSETGYVRSENQDRMSWVRTRVADVFVVSDGMGGHAGGAAAATLTVQVLQEQLEPLDALVHADQALVRALQAANAAVHTRGQTPNPALAGMGATAVVLLAAHERIMVAHVGDSRAYRLDGRGVLHRLTKDHSVVQRMIDAGTLTVREAAHHPDASVLERALGQAPRVAADVSGWLALRRGEVCLLCSDGLCGYVDDAAIASAMNEGGAPQAIADRLVRLALDAGGEDNVTVQVLRYGDERRVSWQRWIGRGAFALATLCAAAAALVWVRWPGFGPDRGGAAGSAEQVAGRAERQASTRNNAAGVSGAAAAGAGQSVTASAASAAASLDAAISTLERARQAAVERFRQEEAQLTQQLDALREERAALESKTAAGIAAGALTPSKPASAANAASAASAPGANAAALTAHSGQGANKTQQAGASGASNSASNNASNNASNRASKARTQPGAAHSAAAASTPKHPPKRTQHPTASAVVRDEPASAAEAAPEPQSADSDSQPVEIKQ